MMMRGGAVLQDTAEHVINEHVDLATTLKNPSLPSGGGDEGTAYVYTCEVLTLRLLFFDFKNSVRERVGDQMLLIWKYMILLF